MAVILKKNAVNISESRKISYAELNRDIGSEYVQQSDRIEEAEFARTALEETLVDDVDFPNEAESEIEPEVISLNGKIMYRDEEYYSRQYIDQQVEKEVADQIDIIEAEKQKLFEQAKQDGYSKGLVFAEQEYEEKFSQLISLINSVESALSEKVKDNVELIQNIIFTALMKIVGDTLKNDNDRINIIRNVIQETAGNNSFVLRLSARDYELLNSDKSFIQSLGDVDIRSDNRVSIGGCIIDTDKGAFDGRLEIQLARLKEAIEAE